MWTNSVRNTERNNKFQFGATSSLRLVAVSICLFLLFFSNQAFAIACESDLFHQKVQVKEVINGHQLRLVDGRVVTLANIVSPQLERDKYAAEPLADTAKRALADLIAEDMQVLLRFDKRRRDRFHHLVAHGFTLDERNIQAWMLAQGYAALLVEPPNYWQQDCYEQLQNNAQAFHHGMWSNPRFALTDAADINSNALGFYRVAGRVQRISTNPSAIWLHLSDVLAIRITQRDLKRFNAKSLMGLKSQLVHVKGWVYPYKSGVNLRIYHPEAFTVID
ncbi:MAG: thermonuclease family protein [Gammaproteobacteria bacterium]|nr:thermonuclease family protein [Gammaproteobacteria bacterium]